MNSAPVQLEFDTPPAQGETNAEQTQRLEVAALLTFLAGRDWITSHEILESSCADARHWNERKLREYANASSGKIISCQRGYKLTARATAEERHHAAAWLRHQASEMSRRASEIEHASSRG